MRALKCFAEPLHRVRLQVARDSAQPLDVGVHLPIVDAAKTAGEAKFEKTPAPRHVVLPCRHPATHGQHYHAHARKAVKLLERAERPLDQELLGPRADRLVLDGLGPPVLAVQPLQVWVLRVVLGPVGRRPRGQRHQEMSLSRLGSAASLLQGLGGLATSMGATPRTWASADLSNLGNPRCRQPPRHQGPPGSEPSENSIQPKVADT
mmetsp:Transcript_128579/g.344958  ORF Transcript_128579/g.344958 Transcript_128579/m.344958 type:complete len:207 (+) Transcript_128579:278-898(+)